MNDDIAWVMFIVGASGVAWLFARGWTRWSDFVFFGACAALMGGAAGLHEQSWFRAFSLGTVVSGTGTVIFWLTRPRHGRGPAESSEGVLVPASTQREIQRSLAWFIRLVWFLIADGVAFLLSSLLLPEMTLVRISLMAVAACTVAALAALSLRMRRIARGSNGHGVGRGSRQT
jgi:hypothetical protein